MGLRPDFVLKRIQPECFQPKGFTCSSRDLTIRNFRQPAFALHMSLQDQMGNPDPHCFHLKRSSSFSCPFPIKFPVCPPFTFLVYLIGIMKLLLFCTAFYSNGFYPPFLSCCAKDRIFRNILILPISDSFHMDFYIGLSRRRDTKRFYPPVLPGRPGHFPVAFPGKPPLSPHMYLVGYFALLRFISLHFSSISYRSIRIIYDA